MSGTCGLGEKVAMISIAIKVIKQKAKTDNLCTKRQQITDKMARVLVASFCVSRSFIHACPDSVKQLSIYLLALLNWGHINLMK